MLKGTIQAIDKIEGDKTVVHDLPSFMRSMSVHLTDQEFQQALKQIPVDGEYMSKCFPIHATGVTYHHLNKKEFSPPSPFNIFWTVDYRPLSNLGENKIKIKS